MQEFVTYILYSHQFDKIYIGYTSNLIQRFLSHNKLATKGYTIKYRPWMVVGVFVHQSKSEALKHEKYLKSGVGRKFIHSTIIPIYKN